MGDVAGSAEELRANITRPAKPIPQPLLDKVLAAEKFNQGFKTTEYLSASLLDQAWHQLNPIKFLTTCSRLKLRR